MGTRSSLNSTSPNSCYWYNNSAYKMILSNTGNLTISGGLTCNGLTSNSQLDTTILNCTDYALISNTLDMGGQLTLTSGDVSIRSGDVVIDDANRFILARNVNTKDINASLYSTSTSQLVLSSARGGGYCLFEANRYGTSSTTYSYLFTDGTTSGIRRCLMAIYNNSTVKIGATTESTDMHSNIYWEVEVNRGARAHGYFADSISCTGFGQQPKYSWSSQTVATDGSEQVSIGPQEGHNLELIAQEVLPVAPECICMSGEENDRKESPIMLSLEYTQLIPILIKAVQELEAELDALKLSYYK